MKKLAITLAALLIAAFTYREVRAAAPAEPVFVAEVNGQSVHRIVDGKVACYVTTPAGGISCR